MQDAFITLEHLTHLGINLEGKDTDSLLEHLNDSLQERVGTEITESLDDEKLEQLVEVQENGSDQDIADWLETNVPELKEIVQDEIDILLGELANSNEDINQAA
jgi:hypothetical protein